MVDRAGISADTADMTAIFGCTISSDYRDLSLDELSKLFSRRALELECMGLTSHAAVMAARGIDHCISRNDGIALCISEESPSISVLNELSIQLQHFSRALYAGILPPDASFIDNWVNNTITENISNILHSLTGSSSDIERESSGSNTSLVLELLTEHIRPMSEGALRSFQWCSPTEFVEGLIASLNLGSEEGATINYNGRTLTDALEKCLRRHKDGDVDPILQHLHRKVNNGAICDNSEIVKVDLLLEDAFERAVVSSLGEMLRNGNGCLRGLRMVLAVAVASIPTLPKIDRCLRSPLRLASLVVTTCTLFDNTYLPSTVSSSSTTSTSQPLMWSLIETTPTSLKEFDIDGAIVESEMISSQLDAIQAALSVCEIIQCYMVPPPLFLLLGDQSEREGKTTSHGLDCSSLRSSRRTYVGDLLTGCGFLIGGLGESISVLQSQSCGIGVEDRITSRKDGGGTNLSASRSTSVEVLCNMVSLGQALILRLSFEYGRKQEQLKSNSYSLVNNDNAGSWTAVAQDINHLCKYFTSKSVPTVWAGHALLQCMLHYNGMDRDFKRALEGVIDREQEKGACDASAEGRAGIVETHPSLGTILVALGVESAHMECLVLKSAVDIFNSVPSCDSKELREVEQLLQLLPQYSSSAAVASSVRTERALMELVTLLSTLQVDLLPLQLRLLSPVDIAVKLLEQRPQAYYEVNGNGEFEEMYSSRRGDAGENEDRQDLILRRTMLRDRPPPGARLVRVLSALQSHSNSDLDPPSVAASAIHTLESEIRLELLFAAINLGELEGAYCLCRALLNTQATISKSSSEVGGGNSQPTNNIAKRISEATLLVIGMLDCPDPDSGDLHQALRYDLLSLTLANTPVCELERYSALWRHLPAPTSTSASSSSSSSSVCRAACIEASQERDKAHIAKARDGLLDMVARMLRRSEDCGSYIPTFLPNSSEMVISAGVDSSRLADAIGHLLLVENSEMVHGLVEKLYADLDKKLSATLVRERQTLTHSSRGRNTTLDEALVNRVACKGFSKNSAKRAVLATMGEGFQQALEWAVEHSLDEDFEYPIAESVKGALLSERQEGLSSFDPESMRSVLQVLADVSEMYMHHCSIRSSAVTTTAADEHSSERSLGVEFTIDEMYPGVDTPDKTYTMALINSEPPTTVKAVGKRVVSGEKFDSFEAAGLVPSSSPLVNQPPSRFSFSSPESQSSQILSRGIEERPLLRSTMAIAETAQTSSISTSSDDALEAIVVLEGERRSKGDLKPSLLVPTSVAKIATAAKVAATNQLQAAGARKASEPSESARAESQPSTVTSLAVSPVRVAAPLAVPTVMKTRSAALAEAIAPTTSTTPLRPPILVPTSVAKVAAAAEVAAANQLQAAGVMKASKMILLPSESVSGESQPSTRPAYLASTSGPTSETVTSLAVSPVGIAASPAVPTAMKTRSAALAEAIAAAAAATPPRPRPPKVLQAAQSSSPTSPTIIAHMALTDTAILPLTSPTSPPPRSLPPWPILSPSVPCTPTEILLTAALIPETIVAASFDSAPTGPGSSISLRPTIAVNPPPTLPTRAATLTKIDKINDSKHGVPTTTTTAAITVPIQDPAAVPVSVPIQDPAAVPVPVSFPIRDPASVPVSVPVPFSPMLGSLVSASKSSIGGQIETSASSAVLPLLHAESKTRQVVASRNKDIENLSMSPTNTATANRTISPVLPGKLSHGKEQIISSSRDKVPSTEEISRVEEIVEKTNLPIDVLKRDVMSTTVPLREEIVVSTGCETNDISCAGSLNSISSVESDQKPIVRPIDSANAVQLINSVCVIKSVGNEIAEQEQTTRDDAEATKGVLSKLVNPAVLPASIQAKDASVPPARVSALTTSKNTVLKAHLVSRLRGVLDVAEDFTNMGMHVADLAKSIANEECVGVATGKGKGNGDGDGDDESDIDSVSEQLFQICRALATHRRLAAFEFLPQLLAVLPTSLLRSVAARTELLIFVNVTPSSSSSSSSSASSSSGSKAASASASATASIADAEEEEQRAKWAMAALRLLAFHTNDDPQTYLPCMPVLYSLTNTYRTIMLFSHLYRGVKGSNINAVMSILKVAEDHLAALKTAVITCDGLAANLYIREASVAIERTTTLSLPSPRSLGSLITSGEGGGDNAPQQSAAAMTIVTAALKQLQEDLAVLRRVNRIPDSEGINSKMLLKLDSDDLYVFEKDKGRLLANSGESSLQAKYKYRQQALIAMGPHLFPQTITHWARVVGRQLSVGTADLSYQYACYTLSNTMTKYLTASTSSHLSSSRTSKVVSSDVDHDPWPLLASELASCVRRMKPEHTHTLCVTITGLTLKAADIPLEREMLYPLTNVPDHAVDILINAICSALQKLALPLTTVMTPTPLTSSSASMTALYTLSALQARNLLPSILSLKSFILALHENLPVIPASSMRDAFLRHCLERRVPSDFSLGVSVELDNAFVSLLLSPFGAKDAVIKVLTPYCEILGLQTEMEIGSGKDVAAFVVTSQSVNSPVEVAKDENRRERDEREAFTRDIISTMVAHITHLAAEFCLTNLHREKRAEGDAVKNIPSISPADILDRMIRNSHSNFGSSTVGKVVSYLHTRLLAMSSSLDPCNHEETDSAKQIFLESCLSMSEPCVVFLKEKEAVDTELRDVAKMTVDPAVELLTTRMLIYKISAMTLNHHALSKLSISLCCTEGNDGGSSDDSVTHFYLDSATNRESLFLRIFAAVSAISNELGNTAAAATPVLALIQLLRCWRVSKSDGSLQRALEGVPLIEGESKNFKDQNNVQRCVVKFPVWMHSRFHFTVWGWMISLCERMKLFESITEMLILDIDLHCDQSMEAAIEAGEEAFKEDIQTDRISPAKELMRQLRDKVIALANNSILPLNFQCTFGILSGGEMASQAAETMESSLYTQPYVPTPSSSSSLTSSTPVDFTQTLFVLLISLSDEMLVRTVARSPHLLSTLVHFTVKCLETRLIAHYGAVNSRFHSISAGTAFTLMSKVITYSTYIEGLPNIFHLGDLQDDRSTGNNANGSTISSLQLPLPLALTPQHLAVQLLASGFFPQAAQIYWTAVMRRPSAMFSAEAATSLMLNHISSAAMPFYFTSTAATPTAGRNMDSNDRPGPPKEVTELSWGWGTWEGRCCRAVR